MYNKLIIAKTKFYMSNEDRKALSSDIADMALNGALVIGSEIEHLLIIDVDTGDVVPVKEKEENYITSETKKEKKYTPKEILKAVKNILGRKKFYPPAKKK